MSRERETTTGSGAAAAATGWIALFALAYLCAFVLGAAYYFGRQEVAAFWPATGLYAAALALTRPRRWPWLVLATFAVAALADTSLYRQPIGLSLSLASGNTLAALAGALILRQLKRMPYERPRPINLLALVAVAAPTVTMLSAFVGALSRMIWNGESDYWAIWQVWWLADALGFLIVAPMILAWAQGPARRSMTETGQTIEVATLIGGTALATWFVFGVEPMPAMSVLDFPYVVIPFLIWAALRFDLRIVSAVMLMIALVVTAYASRGLGPLIVPGQTTREHVLAVQAFLFISAISTYVLSTIVTERRHAQLGLQQTLGDLRHEVNDRVRAEQEKSAIQEQLQQAQKMEAIGQVAGGVAHDFNNLLTVIAAHTALVKRKMPDEPEVQASIQPMEEAVRQASDMSRALLAFSQRLKPNKQPVDLCDLIGRSTRMLDRILPASIKVRVELPPERDRVRVEADEVQLQQVVLNLALNARDAMTRGGELRITVDAPPDEAEHVRLTVRDTGEGMSPEVRSRIFEPFFTTKAPDKGTGLGLSVVRSIVEEHGGRIEMESHVGVGTTFTITLPRASSARQAEASADAEAPRGHGEVILLAEDNDQIRGIVAGELVALGYEVIQAVDGDELMKKHHEHRDRIALLFCDVGLPGRSGLDCLRALRDAGTTTPAIITTGSEGVTLDPARDGRTVLLAKPFEIAELGTRVRDVLDF